MKKVISIMVVLVVALAMISVVYAADTRSDFSSATYKIEEGETTNLYSLKISNVKFTDIDNFTGLTFSITSSNSQPAFSSATNQGIEVHDSKNEVIVYGLEKYFELKQDVYLWIFEPNDANTDGEVVYNKKIDKPEVKKYTDLYFATVISSKSSQLIFNAPWDKDTERNIKVKVGEVTDDTILKSIKNKESNCFEKLLNYAKTKPANIIDETVKSNETGTKGYVSDNGPGYTIKNKVSDGKYYFLYTYVDDENGKYVPLEGITLAMGSSPEGNDWYLFFLGEDNFKWKDFNNGASGSGSGSSSGGSGSPAATTNIIKDNTTAKTVLPATGADMVVSISIFVLVISTIVAYIEVKKYKDVE